MLTSPNVVPEGPEEAKLDFPEALGCCMDVSSESKGHPVTYSRGLESQD